MSWPPSTPLWVSGRVERIAVGCEYHPETYAQLLVGSKVTSELVPEPWNAQDPNAVAVYVEGQHGGYLSHNVAAKYVGVIGTANRAGYRVLLCSTIDLVADLPTVRLNLPWPDDLLPSS